MSALRHAHAAPLRERVIETVLVACGALSIFTTIGIVVVLAVETLAFFQEVSPRQLVLDTQWTPLFSDKHFGIWPLVCGTILTSFIAMTFALPFGLMAAVFLSELSSDRLSRTLRPALELLAGVPTVVYGYFALAFVTPALKHFIPELAGFNALSAGLVMGVMITPLVASLSQDAIQAVPQSLREGAYALGAAKLPTIWRVVLPTAFSGIAAATTLAISRAIGETMIVAIAAGQQARLSLNPFEGIQTMTAYIVQVSLGDTPAGTLEHKTIFVVGASLFAMTLVMNLWSQRLSARLRNMGLAGT